MTGKGILAQKRYNERMKAIRNGKEKPMEYTMTLKEAIAKAGL